jgi:uncharacterized Ntn-hydrolase superfamily protein
MITLRSRILLVTLASAFLMLPLRGQEPAAWGPHLEFHTFSIAAIDPRTGESGVAVTTRVPCVGNGVPWVRAGVGAVATQANTRVAYGPDLLEMMSTGMSAQEALKSAIAADEGAASRQVGVIGLSAGSAQHTGSEANPWAGHRSGPNYVTQGNILVGPEVLEAVATSFEATEESNRHLADRLIEALAAGQAAGGDRRKGRLQSAAVVVADPREGRSRRPDKITVNINVCENPEPVVELRRIYDTISQTLGCRTLEQARGSDVWQLRVILHALGRYRPDSEKLERDDSADFMTQDLVDAVESFRRESGLSTAADGSPAGLVDDETVRRLWAALETAGKAAAVRERLKEVTAVRR